ncbi:CHAT domain-containing protein [Gloeocapsopsis crepidinum LEGE 06123]|uniref:CHAT domain-containing protein n=2 Tax=Gloeocapsopsis crepidinum TaxID=693223 RepID=A0ABR9UMF1_9CHRO|nr:CHAT domain-containing protein [Gloeocapsopsis crepidinum LEGE 06123]
MIWAATLTPLVILSSSTLPVIATVNQTQVSATPVANQNANAMQLMQQGVNFYQAEQFAAAVEVLQQAVQMFRTEGDALHQAQALNYLSLVYQELGQWTSATQAIADSLQLLQTQDNAEYLPILAQALNTQGHLQLAQGQAEKALTTWQQATTTYQKIGDRTGSVGSKINQVQALKALGLYRRALTSLNSVKQLLQQEPDLLIKTTGLRSLGNVLRVIGDLPQSETVLRDSLAAAQTVRSPQNESAALLSLGNTSRAQQNLQNALSYYQQAASVTNSPHQKIQAQLNQLSLLLETQQLSDAQALLPEIQSLLANVPISRTSVNSRINLAQSLICLKQQEGQISVQSSPIVQQCANGEREKAQELSSLPSWSEIGQILATALQQARTLQDQRAEAQALGYLGGLYQQTQQWSDAQKLTEQALLVAQTINASDITYRWQWQLGRLQNATGRTQEAIASYTDAVSSLKSLRNDLVGINPELQFSFRDSVEPVYRELVSLLLQSPSTASQKNLVQARDTIEALQVAEIENFFRTACLDTQPVQIDQVDSSAAVIYPIILGDRLEVIVSLPKQPLRHYATALSANRVESIVEGLRQTLFTQTSRRYLPFAAEVYNWLIRPVAADLEKSGVKTIVFVLDGAMRNIPMAALYDGEQYLVEKYSIALTPGLQLLDPQPLARERLKALTAGLTEARESFAALPNVKLELEQIQSEVPSRVLLNQEFTTNTLQNAVQSSPVPVVHLATHGQFSSKAEETFILSWDSAIDVNQLNTILRTRDTNRRNAIELLVLSACETVAGDKRAALGLAGMAVRAGARSTLATLWSVSDVATASLMGQFYKEYANTSVTKADALRRAQQTLLKDPKYEHPYFWAPYVLVGNWL